MVAKVQWHQDELFPRVGFIVTNLGGGARPVVHFYNQRDTAEQWIKEGKNAVKWTRLSCCRFKALCREHGLRTIFTRKPSASRIVEDFTHYFAQARAERFDAINLYELEVFAKLGADGKLVFDYDPLWELVSKCR